jgi:peptidoglycan/xylan/chitin deacetylase (PgdA/CDA1 family)
MTLSSSIQAYGQIRYTLGLGQSPSPSASPLSPNNNTKKEIILNFYDDDKSQVVNAKPILDKYGFRVTFFIVCNWAGKQDIQQPRMTWQDIGELHKEGHDIESHSMNHKRLNKLSYTELNYEVGQSKQCLADHGVNATVFSPPHSAGWNNATDVTTIAKYYYLSIGGFTTGLMHLHCDGEKRGTIQADCRTFYENGTLTHTNRYDIKEITHNGMDNALSHNDTMIFQKFVELVNSQTEFNNQPDGIMRSIPIIGYHDIDNNRLPDSTDVSLFAAEMKYLYDNGFKVLTMSDLRYNQSGKYLYVNDSNNDSSYIETNLTTTKRLSGLTDT